MAYFICVFRNHGVDGHADESCGDALAPMRGAGGKHCNVTSHGPTTMGFEFADDYADKLVGFIQCLPAISFE